MQEGPKGGEGFSWNLKPGTLWRGQNAEGAEQPFNARGAGTQKEPKRLDKFENQI